MTRQAACKFGHGTIWDKTPSRTLRLDIKFDFGWPKFKLNALSDTVLPAHLNAALVSQEEAGLGVPTSENCEFEKAVKHF